MTPRRLLISFSGGETSAFMAQWLLKHRAHDYDEVAVVFANTGQEAEETLRFVKLCDLQFGLRTVWVEGVTQHGKRQGNAHRLVDFQTASRLGEPFEDMILKYGLPNKAYPHCTRELKTNPITSYVRSLGWTRGSYDTAVGIRIDEVDRMSSKASRDHLIYPLIADVPMTKQDINRWWSRMPFRLRLKGYEGNCKWCWKKSLRKHLTLLTEHPRWYDFPEYMEAMYALKGHNVDGTPRVFFRENRSVLDLRALAAGEFEPADDDNRVRGYDPALDASGGCSESCEAFAGDDDETLPAVTAAELAAFELPLEDAA